jgi:hypothetical protein
VAGAIVLCSIALAYFVGRSRAAGVPAPPSLVYAGYLEEAGQPVTGQRIMSVELFDNSGATGNALCGVLSTPVDVAGGHFRISLTGSTPATCESVVFANVDLWVRVKSGTTTFPLTKIGSIPFALEAQNAAAARTAIGPLDARLTSMEGRLTVAESHVYTLGSSSWSMYAGYCGSTAAAVTGNLKPTITSSQGYLSTKALCEAVAGCGPAAHICSSEDMVRWASMGGSPLALDAWIATGTDSWDGTVLTNDCGGFVANSTRGVTWATLQRPVRVDCNTAHPVACCD